MNSALFSPLTLRELTLPNRIVVSPMCQYNSVEGSATDWHLMHLGSLAMGAAGLLMVEMTNVTMEGRISPRCATLCSDQNERELKRVVDFCRTYGVAKLGVQLAHAGRKGSQQPPAEGGKPLTVSQGGWQTVAPSALPFAENWPAPRALTHAQIQELVADHVDAVRRAERIGFDMIEMHGAHGYLIHQFLSPLSNHRTDEYGGSLENRMRFPLQAFAAMRAAWPESKPLGIRVSATDWVDGGWTPDEAVAFAKGTRQAGMRLHRCHHRGIGSAATDTCRTELPDAVQRAHTRRGDIVTMTVGMIDKPRQAEEIVASGQADMVALARGALV